MTLPQLSASFLYSGAYEKIRDLLQAHAGLSSAAILSALAGYFSCLPIIQLIVK